MWSTLPLGERGSRWPARRGCGEEVALPGCESSTSLPLLQPASTARVAFSSHEPLPGELALAWLLHQPAVTGPITGPRTLEQLESAVAAVDITLDSEALARLDEIFPGHRTAPEDYAW